jgi:hypothetical protein
MCLQLNGALRFLAAMPHQRRASVTFVLVTLGLDALGVGIILPIVPGLVRQLGNLPPDRAAPWVGALIAAYAAMQFFAAPILGELSDRFGRRPIILASVCGLGCARPNRVCPAGTAVSARFSRSASPATIGPRPNTTRSAGDSATGSNCMARPVTGSDIVIASTAATPLNRITPHPPSR